MVQKRSHLTLPGVVRKGLWDWDVWGLTQAVKWLEVGHKDCRGRVAKEADCAKAQG